jgi:hypothetical protein
MFLILVFTVSGLDAREEDGLNQKMDVEVKKREHFRKIKVCIFPHSSQMGEIFLQRR